jgi:hypothetical protein
VYRTVRGLALSGSRGLPGTGQPAGNPALTAPLRVSVVLRARPARELAAPLGSAVSARTEPEDADGLYDAAGSHDARRYSEPND